MKKWSADGNRSKLDRAIDVLEERLVNAFTGTELFTIERAGARPLTDERTSITVNPHAYVLKVVITDFGDETARGDQGQTTVSRSNEIHSREVQLQNLAAQLPYVRTPQQRANIQVRMNELRASINTLTVLDKQSALSHQIRMAVQYSLTNLYNNHGITTVESFKTNRFVPILTEDVKKAESHEDLLVSGSSAMAQHIAFNVADTAAPAKVLEKKADEITINWGSGCGLARGQALTIYSKREILDPETKQRLGEHFTEVGRVRVTDPSVQFASARILEDHGITVGCIARLQPKH